MNLLKVWIAPFPTERGRPSGMCNISMRVPMDEHKQFPLRLNEYPDLKCAKDKGEVHLTLGLLDDESLVLLRDALTAHIEGAEFLGEGRR